MDANPAKLRELAAWYRDLAEQTENPVIWNARLRAAEDFESKAELLERQGAVDDWCGAGAAVLVRR